MSVKLLSVSICMLANALMMLGILIEQPSLERIGGILLAMGVGYIYAMS